MILLAGCAQSEEEEELRQNATTTCGVERWAIKTATDSNAGNINTAPVAGTIALLSSYPAQNGSDFDRIQPTELVTYQLTDVDLIEYRRESDGDYHLVLSDGTRTMIVEIPDPTCVGGGLLATQISAARAAFDGRHGPVPTTPLSPGETVTVTGVAFFDVFHSQTGVAPNAIELHPVLSICFGAACAGPPPTATPPPPPAATHGCASADGAPWLLLPLLLRRRRA